MPPLHLLDQPHPHQTPLSQQHCRQHFPNFSRASNRQIMITSTISSGFGNVRLQVLTYKAPVMTSTYPTTAATKHLIQTSLSSQSNQTNPTPPQQQNPSPEPQSPRPRPSSKRTKKAKKTSNSVSTSSAHNCPRAALTAAGLTKIPCPGPDDNRPLFVQMALERRRRIYTRIQVRATTILLHPDFG